MDSKVIVITGGAGGLGSSCARALKEYKLVITDYAKAAVESAVNQLVDAGFNAVGFHCDITNKESVQSLKAFSISQGEFKGLVHTAGVSGTGGDPKNVFTIDLVATDMLINSFYDVAKENAVVILFASMMGHTVPPNPAYDHALRNPQAEGAYAAIAPFIDGSADTMYNFAKRGVILLCKDNAMRFGKNGARIISVSPGVILTPMAKKALEEHPETMEQMLALTPIKRNGLPEEVAELVKFLISNNAGFITGTDIIIDGGVTTQLLKAN